MLEFNKKKIDESKKTDSFALKRELSLQFKKIKSFVNRVHFNVDLQKKYDSCVDNLNDFVNFMVDYNIENQDEVYLVTGLSSYFNGQIDRLGLDSIKVTDQDLEDARFIQDCFGKQNRYGANGLKVLYTTLPGTTEVDYGMQPFPAGIYEDVFQFSPGHDYNVLPLVGESEVDYYCRNLAAAIDGKEDFPVDKRAEVLERARRLATNFCFGKNRIYLIPVSNILDNKASFGDIKGLRSGLLTGTDLQAKLDELDSFLEMTKKEISYVDIDFKNNRQQSVYALYSNANYSVGEAGIAIYGDFSNKGITYFEIERKYDLMQRKARELGYVDGDTIPNNILYAQAEVAKK